MSNDTIYVDKSAPLISAAWLNDINNAVYHAIGTGAGGNPPLAPADVLTNLGLSGAGGANLLGYQLNATQSAIRLLGLKVSDWVSITDFKNNDNSQVVGDFNGTTGTDNTTGIQNAINYAQTRALPAVYTSNSPASGACTLFVPSGNYKINGTLLITNKLHIRGDGPAERSSGSRWLQFNNAVDLIQINPAATGMSFSIEDMTLAGTAAGAGSLIHATGATGTCNAGRIERCFLGTPGTFSINIERGDDWIIDRNTFDASNGNAISIGTATSTNVVSTLRITRNDFFEIPTRCILLFNVVGYIIAHNHVTRQSGSRTNYFVDGYNSVPFQLKDGIIANNQLNSIDCLAKMTAFTGLVISGNEGVLMGAGAGASLSCFDLTGTCSNFVYAENMLSGTFDTKSFYNDAGGTLTNAAIGGNSFVNTGGVGTAINAPNTTGRLGPNQLTGFTRNYTCADYLAAGLPLTESQTLAYSAAIATDASLGSVLTITATNNTAFTINSPTNPSVGQMLEYTIRNTSGVALGALTLGALFKVGAAWTQPANGFSRAVSFRWNSTNWVEKFRSAADVTN